MHHSVMLDEAIELLAIRSDGVYVDGTVGAGGHSRAILSHLGPTGRVLSVDCDPSALARLAADPEMGGDTRCTLVQGNFADIEILMKTADIQKVSGVLMDLGISSTQLDDPERGLSFSHDGPLDMRLDPNGPTTAADIVNSADARELCRIFREYGEERHAMRVARAILREREVAPIVTTARLAEIVSRVVGRGGKNHPATRVFQALRIEVNNELGSLEDGLNGALNMLEVGGRLVVISFHSLEDRIVKRFMRSHEGTWESLHAGGEAWRGETPCVRRVTRKPRVPTDEEVQRNSRSRSAKCRAAERVTDLTEKEMAGAARGHHGA